MILSSFSAYQRGLYTIAVVLNNAELNDGDHWATMSFFYAAELRLHFEVFAALGICVCAFVSKRAISAFLHDWLRRKSTWRVYSLHAKSAHRSHIQHFPHRQKQISPIIKLSALSCVQMHALSIAPEWNAIKIKRPSLLVHVHKVLFFWTGANCRPL